MYRFKAIDNAFWLAGWPQNEIINYLNDKYAGQDYEVLARALTELDHNLKFEIEIVPIQK